MAEAQHLGNYQVTKHSAHIRRHNKSEANAWLRFLHSQRYAYSGVQAGA